MARLRAAFAMLATLLLWPASGSAQIIGLGNLLNPEGSRLFPQTYLFPRHPGKPDPRWTAFEWKVTQRKVSGSRYRLYFDEGAQWTAEFVAPRIDHQVQMLNDRFDYEPRKPFNYVLFNSQREFMEANIFSISEGVQGVTSTTEASMAIPYWGELKTFDHISAHEMTHQFQVQKITELSDGYGYEVMALLPLWFIEGMAEYYSLGGMDDLTRQYLRDVILYPDPSRAHVAPTLFQPGPLNFVQVYKLGQARIHFLESRYGQGTAQRLLEEATRSLKDGGPPFPEVAARYLNTSVYEMEAEWRLHLKRDYVRAIPEAKDDFGAYEWQEIPGDTLDHFDVSPDGSLVAFRGIDPLIGRAFVKLIDRRGENRVIRVAEDARPGLLSLSFFQRPILALGNDRLALIIANAGGPEIEFHHLIRDKKGRLQLGDSWRVPLRKAKLVQAASPAFSPDGKQLVFVGLDRKSWEDLYIIDVLRPNGLNPIEHLRRLTNDRYSWKDPTWGGKEILASSDRENSDVYSIYALDPAQPGGNPRRLSFVSKDQRTPDGNADRFVTESWTTGSSQVRLFEAAGSTLLTHVPTGASSPKLRDDTLWFLGFRSGRFGLYRKTIAPSDPLRLEEPGEIASPFKETRPRLLEGPIQEPPPTPASKKRVSFAPDSIQPYRPFRTSGVRLDNIAGFFGSGTVGGLSATVSDLMRNYSITGETFVQGSFRYVNAYLFLSSQKGRGTWTTGGYYIIQQRLDNLFKSSFDLGVNTYLHREFGALGAVQYPLGSFTYVDTTLRVAGVRRTDYNDLLRRPEFEAMSPSAELLLSPVLRLGFDNILYETFTGPIRGTGILLEADTSIYPERSDVTERLRLDVSHYVQATQRLVLVGQGVAGASWGGPFLNPFFVSSDDILRGYEFGDYRLLGNYVTAVKGEARYPIGDFFSFPPLRGIFAYDIGSVWSERGEFRQNISSSLTAGFSINLPPLALNFMSSYRIQGAPGPFDRNVFHFTFRYLYL